MSLAGHHKGMDDDILLDMVRILIFLQAEYLPSPPFFFENNWPGLPSQCLTVKEAAQEEAVWWKHSRY